jgi:hypothetical protein
MGFQAALAERHEARPSDRRGTSELSNNCKQRKALPASEPGLWLCGRGTREKHAEISLHSLCSKAAISTPPAVFQNPLFSSPPLSPHLHSPTHCISPILHLHQQQPHPSTSTSTAPKHNKALTRIAQRATSHARITKPNSKTTDLHSASPPPKGKDPASKESPVRANRLRAQHTHAQLSATRTASRPTDPGDDAPPALRKADAERT